MQDPSENVSPCVVWLSIKIRETLAPALADFYLQDESNVTPFNRVQISVS